MTRASGSFEVRLAPQSTTDSALARMSIDKQFSGDLAGTVVKSSAGYVAIERVTGTLGGRKGTFVLQHFGLMNRGTPQLIVNVVPDSGTEELAGLSGTMTIDITGGKHLYSFEYSITPAP